MNSVSVINASGGPQIHIQLDEGYFVGEPKREGRIVGILEVKDVDELIAKLQAAIERAG